MEAQSHVQLTIAIEAGREPMTGWIEGAGDRSAFVGILELIGLLEAVGAGLAAGGERRGCG